MHTCMQDTEQTIYFLHKKWPPQQAHLSTISPVVGDGAKDKGLKNNNKNKYIVSYNLIIYFKLNMAFLSVSS